MSDLMHQRYKFRSQIHHRWCCCHLAAERSWKSARVSQTFHFVHFSGKNFLSFHLMTFWDNILIVKHVGCHKHFQNNFGHFFASKNIYISLGNQVGWCGIMCYLLHLMKFDCKRYWLEICDNLLHDQVLRQDFC